MFPFVYGFLIASDPRFEAALRRCRWPTLAVACAATGALAASAAALTGPGASLSAGAPPGWSALQGLAGWAWIAAIMGFTGSLTVQRARRPPATPAPPPAVSRPRWHHAARYANDAVLPFYLLHEPVIVAAAWLIVRWHAPLPAKYATLVIVSFAATLGLYETLIRRFRITRLLFGMKPPSSTPPAILGRENVMVLGSTAQRLGRDAGGGHAGCALRWRSTVEST